MKKRRYEIPQYETSIITILHYMKQTSLQHWLTALLLLEASICLAQRKATTINDNWSFKKQNDKEWTQVNLPHTYNHDAYNSRNYYQGKASYKRILKLDSVCSDKRYYLKVDAASKYATVSINGTTVGSHAGGYTAFTLDVTPYLKTENTIEIDVDNSRNDVTPISADFTFWGGIYRDVWLIETPLLHFDITDHGADGIYISTPKVNKDSAVISVKSKLINEATTKANLELTCRVTAPNGAVVQTVKKRLRLKPGERKDAVVTTNVIHNPLLWSPENPNLYTVETTIVDRKTKVEIDHQTHKTGLRWWHFDADKGFTLNGKPYKLRGFNRHQDQWPHGVALHDEAHRRDIQMMKDLGANFIRISHYPQDDALLDECDRLGIMAWEEIPIVNFVPDTPGYDDNCEQNLVEMIRQHYNHPSVIAWGYMNEILLTAPGKDKDDFQPCRDRTVALARRLEAKLKEEDSLRTSVMAFAASNEYNEIGLDLEDVAGWNLYHGWYWGELKGFEEWCADQHERYPKHPFMISEWGAGSDRRLHSANPKAFDFSMEYQQIYIEHYLPVIEQTPYIMGGAYWNLIDFNVAARQESMPRVNNKGVFFNNRQPKDVAYYFKAAWRDDIPVIHIATRDRDNFTAADGPDYPVKIYTNCDKVELTVNGVSVGRQKTENYHCTFNVDMPDGISAIMAKGTYKGKDAYDATTISILPMPNIATGEELSINVGSNCDYTSDEGVTWLSDSNFRGGKTKSNTSEVLLTTDDPLFQTWRESSYEYVFDVVNGKYEVELLTVEKTIPSGQLANLLGRGSDDRYSIAARERRFIEVSNGKIIIMSGDIKKGRLLCGIKIRRIL